MNSKMPATNQTIREAIIAEIERQGLSYYQLAKDSGVSPQQISRFCAGERDLLSDAASKLMEALGLQITTGKSK